MLIFLLNKIKKHSKIEEVTHLYPIKNRLHFTDKSVLPKIVVNPGLQPLILE